MCVTVLLVKCGKMFIIRNSGSVLQVLKMPLWPFCLTQCWGLNLGARCQVHAKHAAPEPQPHGLVGGGGGGEEGGGSLVFVCACFGDTASLSCSG